MGRADLHFDPQQTGFKGNLRLLIKPFEQPHLPFKILSAALHCPPPPAATAALLGARSSLLPLLPTQRQDTATFTFSFQAPRNESQPQGNTAVLLVFVFVLLILCCFLVDNSAMLFRCFSVAAAGQKFIFFWLSVFEPAPQLIFNFSSTAGKQDTQSGILIFKLNPRDYKLPSFSAL